MKTKEMPTSKILAIRAKQARQECLTRTLAPRAATAARSSHRAGSGRPIARLVFTLGTLLLLTAAIGAAAAKARDMAAPEHVTMPHAASTTPTTQVSP